jgi:hypothetical protein
VNTKFLLPSKAEALAVAFRSTMVKPGYLKGLPLNTFSVDVLHQRDSKLVAGIGRAKRSTAIADLRRFGSKRLSLISRLRWCNSSCCAFLGTACGPIAADTLRLWFISGDNHGRRPLVCRPVVRNWLT